MDRGARGITSCGWEWAAVDVQCIAGAYERRSIIPASSLNLTSASTPSARARGATSGLSSHDMRLVEA